MKYGKKVSIKNLLAPPSRVDKTIVKDDVKNLLKVLVSGIDLYDKNN
jgi:hypothetical protein